MNVRRFDSTIPPLRRHAERDLDAAPPSSPRRSRDAARRQSPRALVGGIAFGPVPAPVPVGFDEEEG